MENKNYEKIPTEQWLTKMKENLKKQIKERNIKENHCAFCGKLTNYELCRDCYQEAKENYIIKNEKGIWTRNFKKNNEYKFFDEKKEYKLKQDIMNEYEMRVFNLIKKILRQKYTIIPQVNLQSIITTNTKNLYHSQLLN